MHQLFYRGSSHAVQASKPEMLEQAEEIKRLIASSGAAIELVAVNQYYKQSFIGLALSGYAKGKLMFYTVNPSRSTDQIRQEYELLSYGLDPWEQAPNYIKLSDLELGQMELF